MADKLNRDRLDYDAADADEDQFVDASPNAAASATALASSSKSEKKGLLDVREEQPPIPFEIVPSNPVSAFIWRIKRTFKANYASSSSSPELDARRRMRRTCSIITSACAFILLFVTIFTPVFFLVIIPQWISAAFSHYNPNAIVNITRLEGLTIDNPAKPPMIPASGVSTVAGFTISTAITESGYNVPSNYPLTLKGTSTWALSIPKSYLEALRPTSANAEWVPSAYVFSPEDMLVHDGYLHIDTLSTAFRLSAYNSPSALPQAAKAMWAGGKMFLQGLVNCFYSNNPADVPQIQLSTVANFLLAGISIPKVPLSYIYDFGTDMVQAGLTLRGISDSLSAHSNASSTSSIISGFNISNIQYGTSNTTVAQATIDVFLANPLPFDFSFNDFSFRCNISNATFSTITINSFKVKPFSKTINVTATLSTAFGTTPPESLVQLIEKLTLSSPGAWGPEYYLGMDAVTVGPTSDGTSIAWLNDALSVIDIKVPLDLVWKIASPLLTASLSKTNILSGTSGSGSSSSSGSSTGSGSTGSGSGSGSSTGGGVSGGSGSSGGGIGGITTGPGLNEILGQLGPLYQNATFNIDNINLNTWVDAQASDAGGWNVGAMITVTNFKFPFPAELKLQLNTPAQLNLQASRSYATNPGAGSDDNDWCTFLSLSLSEPIYFQNNVLTGSQSAAAIRFTQFDRASPINSPANVPLAMAVIGALVDTFNAGQVMSVPKVRISTSVQFTLGLLQTPPIPINYALDIGSLLVKNGITVPALAGDLAPGQTPMNLPFKFNIANTKILRTKNDLLQADFTIDLGSIHNPVTANLADLSLRLNVSQTAIGYIQVDQLASTAGNSKITFTGMVLAPWAFGESVGTIIWDVGKLLVTPTSKWVVEVDSLIVKDKNANGHQWLEDIFSKVVIRVPWKYVYADLIQPFLTSIMKRITGQL